VVTARTRDVDKLSGIDLAGVDDYITKPFGASELVQCINRVLGEADAAKPAGS
jgi:DNA-binding response OmpR family regulator